MAKPKQTGWDESVGAAGNARLRLPVLVEKYFQHGRELMGSSDSPKALHAFRLETKRLRYTLELFENFYGPGLKRCFGSLKSLQDVLGEINDVDTSRAQLERACPQPCPQRQQIEEFLQARWDQRLADFRAAWEERFDAQGQERWWRMYLSRKMP
jgi:CHAD domain-containing protein